MRLSCQGEMLNALIHFNHRLLENDFYHYLARCVLFNVLGGVL
jgi:hypothetical protein